MSAPSPRVVRADNRSPMTLDGTRTYLVGRSRPVVIDPGPADPRHLRAVADALEGATPAALLLTHAHADHAGGAEELARLTGAPLWMAAGAARLPFPPSRVERWLDDGDGVETDAGSLVAVHTPGHAPEHLCLLWHGAPGSTGTALFVGDLLLGEGDTTLVASPEGDLAAYLRSLDRVEALAPAVLYPAHGPPLTDPAAALRRYREHRRVRIEQVREALRADPAADVGRLVDRVYGAALDPALRRAAEGSVRAVLEHLRGASGG